MSALPCGCDPDVKGGAYLCERHLQATIRETLPLLPGPVQPLHANCKNPPQWFTIFPIKDSGSREQFASGMQRDTADDKINYALILDGPMFTRWAQHLTRGAKKYESRNWMQATGADESTRFRESAFRHFVQWYNGETDEDHAAAVYFNINGVEYVRGR